jgi:hypothetical protein
MEKREMSDTFGLVVERIDDNQTHLGLPDTRGTYHQIQILDIHLVKLKELIERRLWDAEQRELLRMRQLKFERRKDEQ